MPVLSKAPASVVDFVAVVVEAYHPDLQKYGVTIDLLMASPTEKEMESPPPYIKLHGVTAAAIARIIPYKQRVKGMADCEILFDAETWKGFGEDERTALVSHECRHFAVVLDRKTKQLKEDNAGRPKLKTRHHDVDFGWFMEDAKLHGVYSMEVKQAREIQEKYGQLLFSWAEGPPSIAGVIKRAV